MQVKPPLVYLVPPTPAHVHQGPMDSLVTLVYLEIPDLLDLKGTVGR